MGGAYKFTNEELRLLSKVLVLETVTDPQAGQLWDKIQEELTRRDTVAKRSAGKGAIRKRDVPPANIATMHQMLDTVPRPSLRIISSETGVPYGRVWNASKQMKKKQEETNEPGQPNKSGPK